MTIHHWKRRHLHPEAPRGLSRNRIYHPIFNPRRRPPPPYPDLRISMSTAPLARERHCRVAADWLHEFNESDDWFPDFVRRR